VATANSSKRFFSSVALAASGCPYHRLGGDGVSGKDGGVGGCAPHCWAAFDERPDDGHSQTVVPALRTRQENDAKQGQGNQSSGSWGSCHFTPRRCRSWNVVNTPAKTQVLDKSTPKNTSPSSLPGRSTRELPRKLPVARIKWTTTFNRTEGNYCWPDGQASGMRC
jgi:hypothetical protein